jgi:hypothetical protein
MGEPVFDSIRSKGRVMLLAVVVAGSMASSNVFSQSSPDEHGTAAPAGKSAHVVVPRRYGQTRMAAKARQYYSVIWGVDSLSVKSVESGEIIRFSYRVVDADKAQSLNNKKSEPSLIDPAAGVELVVPQLEKIGKLRQSSTPEAGKVYWMAFSNRGGLVKPGHRVDVVIGQFRAQGLIVQ